MIYIMILLGINITKLFSFDKKLSNKARNLDIERVINKF